jgi:hypothetical protein
MDILIAMRRKNATASIRTYTERLVREHLQQRRGGRRVRDERRKRAYAAAHTEDSVRNERAI